MFDLLYQLASNTIEVKQWAQIYQSISNNILVKQLNLKVSRDNSLIITSPDEKTKFTIERDLQQQFKITLTIEGQRYCRYYNYHEVLKYLQRLFTSP